MVDDASLTGCVLIDFRLGGMDGLQLQECLRAMGSALGVVLISAYPHMPVGSASHHAGRPVTMIEKPYRNKTRWPTRSAKRWTSARPAKLAVLAFSKSRRGKMSCWHDNMEFTHGGRRPRRRARREAGPGARQVVPA